MELTPEQATLLDLVDSESTVGEILKSSPLDEEDAVRTLMALHQAGVVELKERRVSADPLELCRQAIELDKDNDPARYHFLGRALAENPKWRQNAEQNLKITHKLEPWEPRYLLSLAQLYQKEGLTERAERVFDQVRTLDPDFPIPDAPKETGKNEHKKTEKSKETKKAG